MLQPNDVTDFDDSPCRVHWEFDGEMLWGMGGGEERELGLACKIRLFLI